MSVEVFIVWTLAYSITYWAINVLVLDGHPKHVMGGYLLGFAIGVLGFALLS